MANDISEELPQEFEWNILNDQSFIDKLMMLENSVRAGFDKEKSVWKPHLSVEGGNDTLAYGHKLTDKELKSGTIEVFGQKISYADGVSEDDARMLMFQDLLIAQRKARRSFNKHRPLGPDVSFDDMPDLGKTVLAEAAFNTGRLEKDNKFEWPNLAKALYLGSPQDVRREVQRNQKEGGDIARGMLARTESLSDWYLARLNKPGREEKLAVSQHYKLVDPSYQVDENVALFKNVRKLSPEDVQNVRMQSIDRIRSVLQPKQKEEEGPALKIEVSGATVAQDTDT